MSTRRIARSYVGDALGRAVAVLEPFLSRLPQPIRGVVLPQTERERERRRIVGLCAPFLLLAAVAGLYPLAEMVRISVSEAKYVSEGFSLDAYHQLVTNPYLRASAFNTLWFSLGTTVVSLGVATATAHALEKYDLPFEGTLVTLLSFPVSLPGIVAAFMIIVLLGNTGLLTNAAAWFSGQSAIDLAVATGVVGLFVAYCYSMIPRALLLLRGSYAEVNTRAEEAARSLGASPARTFYHVTLPQVKPGLIGAFILTFRTALAIFGTVLILQAMRVWTYEIDYALSNGFDIQLAAAMATVWFVFVLGFTVFGLRYTSAEVGL
ncbi:ABC transporter permease [Halogeometricum borinquense]|nr:ABC transporter permease subunit [Halogeometricum borinquense]ADQ68643.1 ABC-type Fe3+ transport system, permease component [Halogeometricum borinquense DSM 11551]